MTRHLVLLLAALAASACGGTSNLGQSPAQSAAVANVPLFGAYELRLLGVNPAGFTSARLRIHSVEVRAGNILLTDAVKTYTVDLATPGQAWLLATFGVPASAGELDATVTLREDGFFDAGARKGSIDASCTVLHVKLRPAQLKPRNHGVIHLDVGRSLVATGPLDTLLVPQFSVHY